jgi:hypothetical protein
MNYFFQIVIDKFNHFVKTPTPTIKGDFADSGRNRTAALGPSKSEKNRRQSGDQR